MGAPYLFEGAWELLPRVPRALADQAREQGCDLLWPQGAQSVVKHELSEEQLVAAHGTSHPPCQLHRACLVHIAQGPEHLDGRRGCWELPPSLASPSPCQHSHLYSLVVLREQQQRLVRQEEAQPLHLLLYLHSLPQLQVLRRATSRTGLAFLSPSAGS